MNLVLLATIVCAIASLPLLRLLARILRCWVLQKGTSQQKIEAGARVVEVHAMNEARRTVPFVKLKVEVYPAAGRPFFADTEGFCSHEEAALLKTGSFINVYFTPSDPVRIKWARNLALSETSVSRQRLLLRQKEASLGVLHPA